MGSFIKKAYAVVGKNKYTSNMTPQEVIDEFNKIEDKGDKENKKITTEEERLKEFGINDVDEFINNLEIDDEDLSIDDLMEALREVERINAINNKPQQQKEPNEEPKKIVDDGNWKNKDYLVKMYNSNVYNTGDVKGKEIFDTSKTGMSFYNDFLNPEDKRCMETHKGLTGEIRYLTPREYFQGCEEIFGIDADQQIKSIKETDLSEINMLKDIITEKKKQFPMTYLNFSKKEGQGGQEGRHRMIAGAELFGWDEKFPVLVVEDT